MFKTEVSISPTTKQVAALIWAMGSDQQAEMFKCLLEEAGSEHTLMMQFMACRDDCIALNDGSLGAFQAMFSSAFYHATI